MDAYSSSNPNLKIESQKYSKVFLTTNVNGKAPHLMWVGSQKHYRSMKSTKKLFGIGVNDMCIAYVIS